MLTYIIDGRGHIQGVSVPSDPAEEMNAMLEIMRVSEEMGLEAWLKTLDPEFVRSLGAMLRTDCAREQLIAAESAVNENRTEGDSGMNKAG